MSLEYETRQQNSALTALKQRAAPPALTDQKPNVLYTIPVQTVERLEEVLRQTLALQKTIQTSMAALATKESLEPLATAEQLHQWLEQTQALNQKTHRAMGEILSEMREEHKRDGRQRDEFIRGGFCTIDFGQTADDTKLKLGCKYTYLYAALHHSNPLINAVCRKFAPFLEYKPLTTRFRVFKEEL